MRTLYIHYFFGGEAVADHEAEEYVLSYDRELQELPEHAGTHIFVSTENVVHTTRLLIKQGRVKSRIIFLFINESGEHFELEPDSNGRIENWPVGFADHSERCSMALL